jgi:hypothetical protein
LPHFLTAAITGATFSRRKAELCLGAFFSEAGEDEGESTPARRLRSGDSFALTERRGSLLWSQRPNVPSLFAHPVGSAGVLGGSGDTLKDVVRSFVDNKEVDFSTFYHRKP